MEIYHFCKQIMLASSYIPHSCAPAVCRQIYSVLKTKTNKILDIQLEDECRFFFKFVYFLPKKGVKGNMKFSTSRLIFLKLCRS